MQVSPCRAASRSCMAGERDAWMSVPMRPSSRVLTRRFWCQPEGLSRPAKCRIAPLGHVLLELFERARPVFLEQPRQRAVGEQFPTGLAGRTVVHFIGGVADALHR